METTVAVLLLLTASVVLACVVVNYAVNIVQITLSGEIPEVAGLKNYVNEVLNQTNSTLNEVTPPLPDESQP
jgi:hypothetical protein